MHFLSQSPSSHFPCYLFLPTWPSLSFSSPLVATQKRVRGLSNLPPASVTCVVWVLVCLPPVPHVHCTSVHVYLHRLLDPRLISLRPYSNIHNYPLPCLLLLSTFLISSSVFFSENFITYTYKYDDDNDGDGDGDGDGGDDHDGDARGDGYDHGDCILVTCPCLQKSIAIFFIAFWIIFIKINWNLGCCLIILPPHGKLIKIFDGKSFSANKLRLSPLD